jgi:para-nitrobenzyl esterase
MTGNTADDAAGFSPPVPLAKYAALAQEKYGELAERYLHLYPAKTDAEARAQQVEAGRDRMRASAYLWGRQYGVATKAPVYTYYFDRATPWPEHPEFGAFHTSDIPYVFRNLSAVAHPYEEVDRRLSEQIAHYLANFAKTGDPNGDGLPGWQALTAGQVTTQELGAHVGAMAVTSEAKLAFWKDYFASPISKSGSPL